MEIYLDNSATTRVCDEAAQVVYDMLVNKYGNPSSLHSKGLEAELAVQKAREQVAKAIGVPAERLYFTSGGTEANNLAVFGAAQLQKRAGNKIVALAAEHSSVIEPLKRLEAEGYEISWVTPDENGGVTPEMFAEKTSENTVLAVCMQVNNELGAVYNVKEIARAVKRISPHAIFHCDAVQAFCKMPLKFGFGYIDTVSVTAHKIHGPKGTGALYINRNLRLPPRTFGGEQESRLRPGTEAAALIAGFGEAADIALNNMSLNADHAKMLCERLKAELAEIEGIEINSPENALPYILNFSACGIRSEIMMHFLEERGIYLSSGSACAKGAKSHVLTAYGLTAERIDSALRVSFSRYNNETEIVKLSQALKDAMAAIRRA